MRWPLPTAKRWTSLICVCVVVAGIALVLISAIIPWAVFTRYVLNSAASWPETDGGSAHHRADVLRRRGLLPARHAYERDGGRRSAAGARRAASPIFVVELLMAAIAVFMIVYGIKLCEATWHNSIAEFPFLSVGLVYSPIPDRRIFHAAVHHRTSDHRPAAGIRPRSASPGRIGARAHGSLHSARHVVSVLRHRHADLLFARHRRAGRRSVDRHSRRKR